MENKEQILKILKHTIYILAKKFLLTLIILTTSLLPLVQQDHLEEQLSVYKNIILI